MQTIEFEAIADQHMLRLPDQAPNGIKLRVLLLLDNAMNAVPKRRPEEDRPRRKPSPKLAGSVIMHDDLITPVVPEADWDTLK